MSAADCEVVQHWRGADGADSSSSASRPTAEESRRVIAVNHCYQRAPWADAIYACDRKYWEDYAADIRKRCSGEFWTINEHAAKVHGLNHVFSEPGGGITRAPNTIREGGNSGFQAIGLALLFGAARITLLGFDMQFTGGRKHWHPDHNRSNPITKSFRGWILNFEELSRSTSVPIVNASRETALRCFPRMGIHESLDWAP